MLWKIQEICSKMGTNFFGIDEEMAEIIAAGVGNPKIQQAKNEPIGVNPEIQRFFRIVFSKNMIIFKAKECQSEKSPILDSQKSTKTITPKNGSQKGLQSLTDVLQHPVFRKSQ